jgi:hypothetical protein
MDRPESGPVFIVGCDRSGTTLLRLMLIQGPQLHMLAETNFMVPLLERAADYGDFSTPAQRYFFIRDLVTHQATSRMKSFPNFDLTFEQAEAALKAVAPTDYPGACGALFAESARQAGKSRWGDKSPGQVMCIKWLASAFPTGRIIHIIRDPRGCVASMKAAGWRGGQIRELARYYVQRVTAGQSSGRKLPPEVYTEIRYEQLVAEPQAVLRRLCEWAELTYDDSMLQFYRRAGEDIAPAHQYLFPRAHGPVGASRAESWKKDLTEMEIAEVESVCGPLMQQLGYRTLFGAFSG